MGAAYLAGLAIGYWQSLEDIQKNWAVDREFIPELPKANREARIKGWKKAVACAKNWETE